MDSLSQALLGASTFALVKNKHIGRSSFIIGAIAGTIPDLDVMVAPFFDEIEMLTIHRSYSHSILFAILGSLFFGYIAHRATQFRYKYKDWTLAFFLALFTHALLDWCTTYGTQLLCPFNDHLFSLNIIHVFEPIYTSILLIGVVLAFRKSRRFRNKDTIIKWTLSLSCIYLCWACVSKTIANEQFVKDINSRNIAYEKLLISPTPLNTFLWNGIIKTQNGYYFGSYSLFDSRKKIELFFLSSSNDLIPKIKQFKKGQIYLEYTQDFPLITMNNDTTRIYAVKFGPINYF